MKVRNSLTIEELYQKVKDYDLVLTIDAALSDGLNSRLESPRLGNFATTPKRLVRDKLSHLDLKEEKELFIDIIKNTNLNWKEVTFTLKNIINCWKETGSIDNILNYRQFKTENVREIINIIKKSDNLFSKMSDFTIEDKKVAVIGFDQFNALDRSILPEDFDEFDFLSDEETELEGFKIFPSSTSISEAVISKIDEKNNANDIAVVTDSESIYDSTIKSGLKAKGIPFHIKNTLNENDNLRAFLNILELSLEKRRHKVKDIQPLLGLLGLYVSDRYNEEYIADVDKRNVKEAEKVLHEFSNKDLNCAIDLFELKFDESLEDLRRELKTINLLDEQVSEYVINLLKYYLDAYEIETDKEKNGVLFVSPKISTYINRSIIFYLGMDSSWMANIPKGPWTDKDKFEENQKNRFTALIQNGNEIHYIVQDTMMNEKVAPCFYFNEILDEMIEEFTDAEHERYVNGSLPDKETFEKVDYDIKSERVETISQSSLNNFVKCPKDYFFDRVTDTVNKDYFRKGNIFHDFAEFYVNYPEFVDNLDKEEIIDFMISKLKPYVDDLDLKRAETEFRIGIDNILAFLKKFEVKDIDITGYKEESWGNMFAERYKKDTKLKIAEASFKDPDFGGSGKVDLILTRNHILDYKSGKAKSVRDIVRNSNIETFEDYPNFQAILYLAYHRRLVPGEKLEFTFLNFLNNMEKIITGKGDPMENAVTITYYPRSFREQLARKETIDILIDGVKESNDRRKVLEKLDHEDLKDFIEENELPNVFDKNELIDSDFADRLIELVKKRIGDYKYVTKGVRSALKKVYYFRIENFFKEDLDAFEIFLKKQLEKLNEYKKSGFPIGDTDLDKVNNRDLIMNV